MGAYGHDDTGAGRDACGLPEQEPEDAFVVVTDPHRVMRSWRQARTAAARVRAALDGAGLASLGQVRADVDADGNPVVAVAGVIGAADVERLVRALAHAPRSRVGGAA